MNTDDRTVQAKASRLLESLTLLGGVTSAVLRVRSETIAEHYWDGLGADGLRPMHSVSKSFTSCAVGILNAEGRLDLDETVGQMLADIYSDVQDAWYRVSVRHLLTMTSGHEAESLQIGTRNEQDDWVRHILDHPPTQTPGTTFVYNTGATHLLSAIVERRAGEPLLKYLSRTMLEPLDAGDASWETSPTGVAGGGWGLSLRTSTLADFGQLYLQCGRWGERQLVPREWAWESTSPQVPTTSTPLDREWGYGYGYQFWMGRNGSCRADGAFGQLCLVIPRAETIVAVTAKRESGFQALIDTAWKALGLS